jgi:predicted GH43/DUF377 family glycosyl hydrolase
MQCLLIFILCLCLLYEGGSDFTESLIVKSLNTSSNGIAFYRVYYDSSSVFQFPEEYTLSESLKLLRKAVNEIPEVPFSMIPLRFSPQDVLPSLHQASFNFNAILASIIARNEYFLTSKTIYLRDVWNPSVSRWLGKIIISWRNRGVIQFSELSSDFNKVIPSKLFTEGNDRYIIAYNGNKQEDARLFPLSDGTLLVAFTAVTPPLGKKRIPHAFQSYSIGRYHERNNSITFDEPYLFNQDFGGWQKNWIPFEFEKSLYFIQSIFPQRILRVIGKSPTNHTVQYEDVVFPSTARISSLPWKEEPYGWLRGGSPMIRLTGKNSHLFLMMFHSVYSFRDYYMGAMTLCASPPFLIHSMSAFPIVNLEHYRGQRMSRKVPYVVFPTSLLLEGDNELLLVFGHQDKNGYISRFPLDDLLKSLTLVQDCP